MEKKYKEFYDRCIRVWGVDAQIKMCIEEMSELTKELCKFYRAGEMNAPDEVKNHVIEEIADVQNMVDQMQHIFGEDAVDRVREEKKKRTEKYLEIDERKN
ncbi:MAG: hypothetical protein IJ538_00685 [Clostridia bacterium]|nr:hypothetical protein [Clostridia bacterium]